MKLCDQLCLIWREKYEEQLRIQVPPLLMDIILSLTTVVLIGLYGVCVCVWGKNVL